MPVNRDPFAATSCATERLDRMLATIAETAGLVKRGNPSCGTASGTLFFVFFEFYHLHLAFSNACILVGSKAVGRGGASEAKENDGKRSFLAENMRIFKKNCNIWSPGTSLYGTERIIW
jgi:hypothetical protein